MLLIKLYLHLIAKIRIILLKSIYKRRIKIGKKVTFRRRFDVMISNDGFLEIGDGVFFNNDCSINVYKSVKIGCDSIFGESVKIYDHNHRFNNRDLPIKQQGYKSDSIEIGSNCWIASNVTILKGTKIGDNCVIGAGCIVDGIIEDNKVLRMRNRNYFVEERR